jgi:HEPN domain-containing protein
MRQALKDLRHAERSLEFGDYEWACFAAQQAAEEAVKALYESRNMEVWGHSVSRMLEALPEDLRPDVELIESERTGQALHTDEVPELPQRGRATRLLYEEGR